MCCPLRLAELLRFVSFGGLDDSCRIIKSAPCCACRTSWCFGDSRRLVDVTPYSDLPLQSLRCYAASRRAASRRVASLCLRLALASRACVVSRRGATAGVFAVPSGGATPHPAMDLRARERTIATASWVPRLAHGELSSYIMIPETSNSKHPFPKVN